MLRPIHSYAAVLFDLDGVLTPTAAVHRRAWKRTFDRVLQAHRAGSGDEFTREDYLRHVDGRPREEGVHAFLASRGITLPKGHLTDPPSLDSEMGIGTLKNAEFNAVLATEGVVAFPGSVALIDHLEHHATPMAVVSSSANARAVLAASGLRDRFEVIIDGLVARERGLAGKPAPDTFAAAAADLGAPVADTVVVEDALSGIEAGVAGGFGLVVAVDRGEQGAELAAAGADVVVTDLAELLLPHPDPPAPLP